MKKYKNIIIIIASFLLGLALIGGIGLVIHTLSPKKIETKYEMIKEKEKEKPQEQEKIEIKKPITNNNQIKNTITSQPKKEKPQETTKIDLGEFKITGYCSCEKCCGKTDGITASGKHVQANHTIAAPSNFPFGTKLMIDDKIYIVEDRGGAIKDNKLDIYFNTHKEALDFGVQYKKVFKIN